MVPKPTQEKCPLPANSRYVGTHSRGEMYSPGGKGKTRRRTAVERRRGVPCQLRNASSGKNGCFQTTAQDWREPGGRGADSQATGISRCGARGLSALLPSAIPLATQPAFPHRLGGVLSPRSFRRPPSLQRATLPSFANSHSAHLWGHLCTPSLHFSHLLCYKCHVIKE